MMLLAWVLLYQSAAGPINGLSMLPDAPPPSKPGEYCYRMERDVQKTFRGVKTLCVEVPQAQPPRQ